MKLIFEKSFEKDLKKIKDKDVLQKLKNLILEISKVDSLFKVNKDIKKMKSNTNFWRIKIGNYRIGIEKDEDKIIFVRILNRKDIYKYFP